MRLEDRQIDGHELEQDNQREKSPLEQKRTQDLPGISGDELRGQGGPRHELLLEVMRGILDNQETNLGALQLPQRELRALEALQVSVTGRSADIHGFVYAEDRRTMLEQALAVLQPDLISHDGKQVAELQQHLQDFTLRVTDLREQLMNLEDGQDDRRAEQRSETKAEDAETDDKPVDPDAPRPASMLTGPAREEPKKAASTLTGPAREEPAAKPTTLGDADEIAAAAKKKPWWRRALGG